MPTRLSALSLVALALVLAPACGSVAEDDGGDDFSIDDQSADPKADSAATPASATSFNPMRALTAATTAAAKYAPAPSLTVLTGTLAATSSAGVRTYRWTMTLRNSTTSVDLGLSAGKVRVIRHTSSGMAAGASFVETARVKTTAATLLTRYAARQVKSLSLTEPFTQHRTPHWVVTFDNDASVFVDATTGTEQ
jgi:hypothetical protein